MTIRQREGARAGARAGAGAGFHAFAKNVPEEAVNDLAVRRVHWQVATRSRFAYGQSAVAIVRRAGP